MFSTKQRQPWIGPALHERMYAFMGGILRAERAQLIAENGMADHVHLLLRFPPDAAPAVLAREVKSRSSRWVHETFPAMRDFGWQRGHGGFTVGEREVGMVEAYIRGQQEHHARESFKDEFLRMLREAGIDFDPRYVFE